LVVFAGPCVLEDQEKAVAIAKVVGDLAQKRNLPLVFKASFDKANRTSVSSYRGPGCKAGLEILSTVKAEVDLPIITDIHLPDQAEAVAETVDVLQIPAFLCRQTDLLQAAGKTGKPINIKKGQFLAPQDMVFAAEKVIQAGGKPLLCERGTSFGYRDLVVDMRSLVWMRQAGFPVIFDGTHSVQQPGAAGGSSSGLREMVAPLVRAAVAVGVDGLYLEVHSDPDKSPSDAANSLSPDMFAAILDEVVAIRQ
jgi:2-dehydro-3-deoxyphosphooctonate aldolase (KDO 8-P synthase)